MFNCNIQIPDNICTGVISVAFTRTFSIIKKYSKQTHYISPEEGSSLLLKHDVFILSIFATGKMSCKCS
jgi:hypothetical protein